MNRNDLVRAVAARLNTPYRQTEQIIESFLDILAGQLAEQQAVTLREFGRFDTRHHLATMRRHPSTGEPIQVAARTNVHFTAAAKLRDRVNRDATL